MSQPAVLMTLFLCSVLANCSTLGLQNKSAAFSKDGDKPRDRQRGRRFESSFTFCNHSMHQAAERVGRRQ